MAFYKLTMFRMKFQVIMCSGATEGEMKLDTYVGKCVSLSSCFFFGQSSYTDLRDKLNYVSELYLVLFKAFSEQRL